MTARARIVVLVSGSGTNLQAIIDHCETNYINGDVVAVISNKPNVYALTRAKQHKVPSLVIDHTRFDDRESFDRVLETNINKYAPDLVILAGFMRILSHHFVEKFMGKMLNIHPSLLPKYPGLNTHKRAIENKDSVHGSSVHFVTPELDGGPVVLQSELDIESGESFESLQNRVAQTEWLIYPMATKWFCDGDLKMVNNRTLLSKKIVSEFTNLQTLVFPSNLEKLIDCRIKIKHLGAEYNEGFVIF